MGEHKIIKPSDLIGQEKVIFQAAMMINKFEWVCPYIDKDGNLINKAAWSNGFFIIPEDEILINYDEFKMRIQYAEVL